MNFKPDSQTIKQFSVEKRVRFADRNSNPARRTLPKGRISRSADFFTSPSPMPLTPLPETDPNQQRLPMIKYTLPTPDIHSQNNHSPRSVHFFKTPSNCPFAIDSKAPSQMNRIFSTLFLPPPPPSQVFNTQVEAAEGSSSLSPPQVSPSHGLEFSTPPSPVLTVRHTSDFFNSTQKQMVNKTPIELSPLPETIDESMDVSMSPPHPAIAPHPTPTPIGRASDFFKLKTSLTPSAPPTPAPLHASDFFKSNANPTTFHHSRNPGPSTSSISNSHGCSATNLSGLPQPPRQVVPPDGSRFPLEDPQVASITTEMLPPSPPGFRLGSTHKSKQPGLPVKDGPVVESCVPSLISLQRWTIHGIRPLYVHFSFVVVDLTPCSTQAISPRDLESMHQYIMARYNIQNLDDYLQILALFRNTRAIEAQNARQRHMDLLEACKSVERSRLSIILGLQERHSDE